MACSGPTSRTFAYLWLSWNRRQGRLLRRHRACTAAAEADFTPVLRQTFETLERLIFHGLPRPSQNLPFVERLRRLPDVSALSGRGGLAQGRTVLAAQASRLRFLQKPWIVSRPFREICRAFRLRVQKACFASPRGRWRRL